MMSFDNTIQRTAGRIDYTSGNGEQMIISPIISGNNT
jgi:hypothetical protein